MVSTNISREGGRGQTDLENEPPERRIGRRIWNSYI